MLILSVFQGSHLQINQLFICLSTQSGDSAPGGNQKELRLQSAGWSITEVVLGKYIIKRKFTFLRSITKIFHHIRARKKSLMYMYSLVLKIHVAEFWYKKGSITCIWMIRFWHFSYQRHRGYLLFILTKQCLIMFINTLFHLFYELSFPIQYTSLCGTTSHKYNQVSKITKSVYDQVFIILFGGKRQNLFWVGEWIKLQYFTSGVFPFFCCLPNGIFTNTYFAFSIEKHINRSPTFFSPIYCDINGSYL